MKIKTKIKWKNRMAI